MLKRSRISALSLPSDSNDCVQFPCEGPQGWGNPVKEIFSLGGGKCQALCSSGLHEMDCIECSWALLGSGLEYKKMASPAHTFHCFYRVLPPEKSARSLLSRSLPRLLAHAKGPANATASLASCSPTYRNPLIASMDDTHPDWEQFCNFDACESAGTEAPGHEAR